MGRVVPAVLLSLLVWPGTGQLYNRQWLKALGLGGAFTVFAVLALGPVLQMYGVLLDALSGNVDPNTIGDRVLQAGGHSIPFLVVAGIFYLVAAADAFMVARRRAQELWRGR